MRMTIGVLVGVVLVAPAASAVEDEPLPTVQVEVELPDRGRTINAPSGLTITTTVDEPVIFLVSVFEEGDRYSPVRVDDTSALLEVRPASDEAPAVRFVDMDRVSEGVYATTHRFSDSGDFVAEVLPDVDDRSRLGPESADQMMFKVESAPTPVSDGPATTVVMALLALVVLGGLLIVRVARGRSRSAKEPLTHDTWWNSP